MGLNRSREAHSCARRLPFFHPSSSGQPGCMPSASLGRVPPGAVPGFVQAPT